MYKVYVSAALTQVENPIACKDFYEKIGFVCQVVGFQSYVPHLHTDPVNNPDITPREVFEHDTHEVTTSDLVIAYLGSPSFGVGMELAYAQAKNIPIILLYEKGKKVSRYPRGIPSIIAEIEFNGYDEALIKLKDTLEQVKGHLIKTDNSNQRPTWDEYFLMLAKLAATRSTCLAFPVGAVIVKNKQVVATGYNGSPSGSAHCTSQGYCYPDLRSCDASKDLPSRAVHAEANAIAQAAKHGISTEGSSIYVTLEPCLSCLKLIISAGIKEIFYETCFNTGHKSLVRDSFVNEGLVKLKQIQLSEVAVKKAALFLIKPTSVIKKAAI